MAQVSELSGSQTAADGAFGKRILALADHLASWSETADALTCTYLSTAHLAVAEELAKLMKKAGLTVEIDTVENVVGRYQSPNPAAKTVIVGSHYDTVRNAGKYDGRLGILTGLVVAEHLASNGIALPFNLEVIAFADEEGVRFPASYIGSRAVVGRFEDAMLAARDAKGITLAQALLEVGKDPKNDPCAGARPGETRRLPRSPYRAGPGAAGGEFAGRHRHRHSRRLALPGGRRRRSRPRRHGADGAAP